MLGVLWHPEEDEADRLIGAFVEECRKAAVVRTSRYARDAGGPDRSGPPVRAGISPAPRQPVKRGATVPRAQRRNVSGSLRACVPLPATNVTRATTRWRPKP